MDLSNQQGKLFHCVSELAGVSGTDKACVLLINPIANTVRAFITLHLAGTESTTSGLTSSLPGIFIHRIYSNPTVTANGNALSIYSSFITGANGSAIAPSSTLNAYSLPTVTSNGSKIFSLIVGGTSQIVPLNSSIIIAPGNSILVTCTPSNPTTLNARYLFQWEEG